jgi:hypothetical protein
MPTENKIFGYEWDDIKRAQQGGSLSMPITGNQTASVQCHRCNKYFRLPQTMGTDPWPVQCLHCGYAHTYNDARMSLWPMWDEEKRKRQNNKAERKDQDKRRDGFGQSP